MDFEITSKRANQPIRRWARRLAVAAATLLCAAGAQAMSPDVATDCENCKYPTAVRMPSCTGVYMGDGLVLTAGHCIDNVTEGVSKARFGEQEGDWEYEIVIQSCAAHPSGSAGTTSGGDPGWTGADIGYCILEDHLEDLGAIQGATPIIPPMIPEGCERDWLAHQVYETVNGALVTAVGAGCGIHTTYDLQDCEDGTKRSAGQQLVSQTSYSGSSTKLELQRDLWNDADDTGIRRGDSGGPVFIRMPDQTYRVVGVIHGWSGGTGWAEAVPPYLHWVEQDSGIDITPYHYYSNGNWVSTGATALLPAYEYEAYWGEWLYTCSAAPKAYSDSYTDEPFIQDGIQCPGWPVAPTDELAAPTDDDGEVLEGQLMDGFQTLESSDDDTRFEADGFLLGEDYSVAPLPFLPVESVPQRESDDDPEGVQTFDYPTYELDPIEPTTR